MHWHDRGWSRPKVTIRITAKSQSTSIKTNIAAAINPPVESRRAIHDVGEGVEEFKISQRDRAPTPHFRKPHAAHVGL